MKFINRSEELALLQQKTELFSKGVWDNTSHVALLGLRRTGKTFLIKHYFSRLPRALTPVFFDFSKFANTPRDFSRNLIRKVLEASVSMPTSRLLPMALESKNDHLIQAIDHFENELLKNGDNAELIHAAFGVFKYFPHKKWVIAFDEFQEIVSLEKFNGINNIDSIFRAYLQESENVFYILSGSYPTMLTSWLSNPKKYLFSHFSIISIDVFGKRASGELAKSIVKGIGGQEKSDLFTFSGGNPYLLTVMAKQYLLKEQSIDTIFKEQVFSTGGIIYNYFSYWLDESMKKVPGEGVLKEVVKYIALSDAAPTTKDLSEKIGKSLEEIHQALNNLIKVDLIYVEKRRYHFSSKPFMYFLRYKYRGLEEFEFEKGSFYRSKLHELTVEYQKVATELGRTKEFELNSVIEMHQGKKLWGIHLPTFDKLTQNYRHGDTEIDLYTIDIQKRQWIFELKWKNKRIGEKEIGKCLKKINAYRYVYVSKSGFTQEAIKIFANAPSVLLVEISGQLSKGRVVNQ